MTGTSRLTVLAGPTAVGKGTVAAHVREHHPDVWLSVSATTRRPRPDEVDGLHYHFMTNEDFGRMVDHGDFLEWATVHGRAQYGTPRGPVEPRSRRAPALPRSTPGCETGPRDPAGRALRLPGAPQLGRAVRRLVGRGTESRERRSA